MGHSLAVLLHSILRGGGAVSASSTHAVESSLLTYTAVYINLPVGGVVGLLLVFTRVPDQNVKDKPMAVVRQLHTKLDLVGFVIFAPAVIMLLLALQWGGNV